MRITEGPMKSNVCHSGAHSVTTAFLACVSPSPRLRHLLCCLNPHFLVPQMAHYESTILNVSDNGIELAFPDGTRLHVAHEHH